jgi:hypothetical protein
VQQSTSNLSASPVGTSTTAVNFFCGGVAFTPAASSLSPSCSFDLGHHSGKKGTRGEEEEKGRGERRRGPWNFTPAQFRCAFSREEDEVLSPFFFLHPAFYFLKMRPLTLRALPPLSQWAFRAPLRRPKLPVIQRAYG